MTTKTDELDVLVKLLRSQANEIADSDHNGWGNTMTDAADEIERLHAELAEFRRLVIAIKTGVTNPKYRLKYARYLLSRISTDLDK